MTQGVSRRTGIDESWSHASPATLASLGYGFVFRYLGPDPSKNITRAEALSILGAGLQVGLVFEGAAQAALQGFSRGVADARDAAAQALAVGQPIDRPIFFAVDWDVQAAELPTVTAYFKGAALVLGAHRVGVYGGLRIVSAVLNSGYARWAWQTYAWSGGRWDARAQVQQYLNGQQVAGASVDLNRATVDDFGGWGVGEADMPLTSADAPIIKAAVVDALNDTAVLDLIAKYVWESAGGAAAGTPSFLNQVLSAVHSVSVAPVLLNAAQTEALANAVAVAAEKLIAQKLSA